MLAPDDGQSFFEIINLLIFDVDKESIPAVVLGLRHHDELVDRSVNGDGAEAHRYG